jgi:hypothetical protein
MGQSRGNNSFWKCLRAKNVFNKIVQNSVEKGLSRELTARASSGLHGLHYDGARAHEPGIKIALREKIGVVLAVFTRIERREEISGKHI